MTTRSEILATADGYVNKDRNSSYGGPEDSFTDIGRIWGVLLHRDAIPPETVAAMLAGLKLARLGANPGHEDSWVDLAGYAACGGEIATRKPTLREMQEVVWRQAADLAREAQVPLDLLASAGPAKVEAPGDIVKVPAEGKVFNAVCPYCGRGRHMLCRAPDADKSIRRRGSEPWLDDLHAHRARLQAWQSQQKES